MTYYIVSTDLGSIHVVVIVVVIQERHMTPETKIVPQEDYE